MRRYIPADIQHYQHFMSFGIQLVSQYFTYLQFRFKNLTFSEHASALHFTWPHSAKRAKYQIIYPPVFIVALLFVHLYYSKINKKMGVPKQTLRAPAQLSKAVITYSKRQMTRSNSPPGQKGCKSAHKAALILLLLLRE